MASIYYCVQSYVNHIDYIDYCLILKFSHIKKTKSGVSEPLGISIPTPINQ